MTEKTAERSTMPKSWATERGIVAQPTGENVLQAAYRRIRQAFDDSDTVVVSFSGGKDSTCLLHLALDIAEEKGRLPLKVKFYDEELVDPDTLEYVTVVMGWPNVEKYWFCIPVRHTLKSEKRVWWWPWDPAEREVWAREMPDWRDEFPAGWEKGDRGVPEASTYLFNHMDWGRVAQLSGIRVQESFNRRRALMQGGISSERGRHLYVKPIFDWAWRDVWYFLHKRELPYSAYYDKAFMAGLTPHWQRVAPWGNAAQGREVRLYPMFYSDFWEKAIIRLPEMRAMSRYGDTKIFRSVMNKPDGMTWQQYTWAIIESFKDEDTKRFWINHIRNVMRKWTKKNSIPFPDEPPEIIDLDGEIYPEIFQCWKRLASIVAKNDRFGRDKT